MINPVVRGWMHYYGAFHRSALSSVLARINTYLMRWIRKEYKRYRAQRKARSAWERVTTQYPLSRPVDLVVVRQRIPVGQDSVGAPSN